jgi:hypothetical protein
MIVRRHHPRNLYRRHTTIVLGYIYQFDSDSNQDHSNHVFLKNNIEHINLLDFQNMEICLF